MCRLQMCTPATAVKHWEKLDKPEVEVTVAVMLGGLHGNAICMHLSDRHTSHMWFINTVDEPVSEPTNEANNPERVISIEAYAYLPNNVGLCFRECF